ncbi:hypothetical protein LTR84_005925 [Exophiala bonariae]|uniref:ADF-H domain-containing protein n=1 Tax=Exophiala bonariae TaxID=1690606 RepID=A0AAV9N3K0_9EURO|nr:hypothetical protein LTR84_005925 [Exophiala bonariae]
MQSGISASADLQNAFAAFASDSALFALPVTISNESLNALPAIPFPSTTSSATLVSSLSSLEQILSPTIPLYLLLRKTPTPTSPLLAATYIPSRAPVRQKTLFASTRASLVRELGSEKFSETLFLTEKEEVLDPKTWADADSSSDDATSGAGGGSGTNTALLSTEERELQAVKRAEEEARHGTRGRDLMNEGGSGGAVSLGGGGSGTHGVSMKVSDEAREGLAAVKAALDNGTGGAGVLVQFGIDIPNETFTLVNAPQQGVAPADVHRNIPADRPTYSVYAPGRESGINGVLFIYVCPGTSKVKERMVYASSGRFFVTYAKAEFGITVLKRLEASEPEDLDGARIPEEIAALSPPVAGDGGADSAPGSGTATPRGGGFARPKRPGKR